MGCVVLAYATVDGKGPRTTVRAALASRAPLLLVATLGAAQACSIILLSYGFVLTYAANAVLLYSMHPLWSAVFGWAFLDDALPARTIVALVAAVVSLGVMFGPDLVSGSFGGGTNALGDGCAFATSFTMAVFLTTARAASRAAPDVSVPFASSLGLFFAALVLVAGTFLTDTTVLDGISLTAIAACAVDGLAVGIVNVAFAIAPAYVSATEVGLISLIEAVVGPIWVFVIFGERPPTFTLIGGAMIVGVLAGHELAGARRGPVDEEEEDPDGDQYMRVGGSASASLKPPARRTTNGIPGDRTTATLANPLLEDAVPPNDEEHADALDAESKA
mmetsp:Transcript_7365/g.30499  ORF Transcript_7365/g.30499 Transcript_7365/m.30499 type:complete len:333 (-) Transcript_7365:622-1620(-)